MTLNAALSSETWWGHCSTSEFVSRQYAVYCKIDATCRLWLSMHVGIIMDTRHGIRSEELRATRVQVTLVEPRFNRLIVFDGRYPHGVRMVEGTRDPVKARAVLHGWFTEPAPFFDGESLHALALPVPAEGTDAQVASTHAGSLPEEAATEALQCALDDLYEAGHGALRLGSLGFSVCAQCTSLTGCCTLVQDFSTLPPCVGTVIVRFTVSGTQGVVTDMRYKPCGLPVLMYILAAPNNPGDTNAPLCAQGAHRHAGPRAFRPRQHRRKAIGV